MYLRFLRNALIIAGLLSLFILTGCSEPDSGIPEVTITDPGAISPIIALSRYIDADQNRTDLVQARLYDKDQNLLRIKNGGISVGDSTMKISDTGYELVADTLGFLHADSTYDVAIMLSDGNIYHCYAPTPKSDLNTIYAPTYQSRSEPLPIAWQAVDSVGPQTLEYYYYYTQNNQLYFNMQSYVLWTPNTGVYSISSQALNIVNNINSVKLVLHYSKDGTMDAAFRSDGSIGTDFAVEANVSIID